jgi:hypothetical protein
MTTWLFTWNPARWQWESLPRDARAVRSGRTCSEDYWTTGTTTSARAGDRFFLLKQGPRPRGIIGSGWVRSDSFADEHWDAERAARGLRANFVRIEFDCLLDPAKEQPFGGADLLLGPLAGVNWTPYASGTRIPSEAAQFLESAWRRYTSGLVRKAASR